LAAETQGDEIARLFVLADENKFALCALVGHTKESQSLDLNFDPDTRVVFSVEGSRTPIHLTGYYNLIDDEIPEGLEGDFEGEEPQFQSFASDSDEEGNGLDHSTTSKLLKQLADEDSEDDEDFEADQDELNDSKDYHLDLSQLEEEEERSDSDDEINDDELRARVAQLNQQQAKKQEKQKQVKKEKQPKQPKQPKQEQEQQSKKRKHEEVSSPQKKKQKTQKSPQQHKGKKGKKK
jgi:hypothetical protein